MRLRNFDLDFNLHPPTPTDKYHYCEYIIRQNIKPIDFAARHNVERSTISKWMKLYHESNKAGVNLFYNGGRPPYLRPHEEDRLRDWVNDRRDRYGPPGKTAVTAQTLSIIQDRKASINHKEVTTIDPKTINVIMEKMGLLEVMPQVKTSARVNAEADPRNAYTMIAMMKAFCEDLNPHMIFNWDATQFVVTDDKGTKKVVIDRNYESDEPVTVEGTTQLAVAIKLYHFHCAAGTAAPPVWVVADKSMGDDDFYVEKIPGMSTNGLSDDPGYICFTKTRCCNKSFYRWYIKEVVTPFIAQKRVTWSLPDMRGFVYCDGEAKQIEAFQEELMLQLLRDLNIDLGKTPASCSGICQSSDVSNFFKAAKKHCQFIDEERPTDFLLRDRLVRVFAARHSFGATKRGWLVKSLIRVHDAVKETLTCDLIRDGYVSIGQYPATTEEGWVDNYKKQMRKCTAKLTEEQKVHMRNNFNLVVQKFRNNGVVTEQDMDEWGIPSVHNSTNSVKKDQRALHQQRAVIMNKQDCIDFVKKYVAKRDCAAAARVANAATNKRKREERVAEQARKRLLTPDQMTAEKKQKAKESRERTKAKKQAEIAEAAAARIANSEEMAVGLERNDYAESDFEISDEEDTDEDV